MQYKIFLWIKFFFLSALVNAQPQPMGIPDQILYQGTTFQEFNFTDGFPAVGGLSSLSGQVIVTGSASGDSYLIWDDGAGNKGQVTLPKARTGEVFKVSDMLVSYVKNKTICYIVGSHRRSNDPLNFARVQLLAAEWDPAVQLFVFGSPQNLTSSGSQNGWEPRIAQDYKGNAIVCWWTPDATPSTQGSLVARKLSFAATAPYFTATSNVINITSYLRGAFSYAFSAQADVSFYGGELPSPNTSPISFVLHLRSNATTTIKTYQVAFDNPDLSGGQWIDIVSLSNDYSISTPAIAAVASSSDPFDFAVSYTIKQGATGEAKVELTTKHKGLFAKRTLNSSFSEHLCTTTAPQISGGYQKYVVSWVFSDCFNILGGGRHRMSAVAKYLNEDGSDFLYGFVPSYFVVNNDYLYDKYLPAVALTPHMGRVNIYLSFLYGDGSEIVPVGTSINYYLVYKTVNGYAFRSDPSITFLK